MSFWKKEKIKPEYLGSQESLTAYQNILQSPGLSFGYTPTIEGLLTQAGLSAQGIGVSPLELPSVTFGYTPSIENLLGQAREVVGGIGQGSLNQAASQYWQDILSGRGINPYVAGSPYQQYQQAALESFQRDVLPQVATQAATKGLLRGSAAERMTGRATSSLSNLLQQQAYDAYQRALQRQYGAAQFIPQQQLAERQAALSGIMGIASGYQGLGQTLAGIQQQNIANQLAQAQYNLGAQQARLSGLMGVAGGWQDLGKTLTGIQQQNIANQLAAAQAINASYGLPAYAPSGISQIIGGLGKIAGPAMGLAGALTGNPLLMAAGFGTSGIFGGREQQQTGYTTQPYRTLPTTYSAPIPTYPGAFSPYGVTLGSVYGF